MKKLLPVVLALVGIGSGVGAGIFLKPMLNGEGNQSADCEVPTETPVRAFPKMDVPSRQNPNLNREYVKMNNQFVVPIVNEERVSSLVAISLSVEVTPGSSSAIYQFEPKLRDGFLQVLFDHANVGGFRGSFTESGNMAVLRRALLETAQNALGNIVTDVMITEIARQDS